MTAITTAAVRKSAPAPLGRAALRAMPPPEEVREVPMSEDRADRIIEGIGEIKGQLSGLVASQAQQHDALAALEVRVRLLEQRPVPPSLGRVAGVVASMSAVVGTAVVLLDRLYT